MQLNKNETVKDTNLINTKSKKNILKHDTILTHRDTILFTSKEIQDKNLLITFKNESNYFKDFLPILTLLLGIFLNRGYENWVDKKRLKKSGERWIVELIGLKKPIKTQIGSLESFVSKNSQLSLPNKLTIDIIPILNCSTFELLDKLSLIKYLEKFKKKSYFTAIENANGVQSLILVLKEEYNDLYSLSKEYLTESEACLKNFVLNVNDFLEKFSDYSLIIHNETKKEPNDDERFIPIAKLVNEYLKSNKDYSLEDLETLFFEPALNFFSPNRFDENIKPLMNSLTNCQKNITAMKKVKQVFHIQLHMLIDRYKEDLEGLENILKLLK